MRRFQFAQSRLLPACTLMAACAFTLTATADEVCVGDSSNFQAQLALVQIIPQPRTIKLVRSATAYLLGAQTNLDTPQALAIEGGYNTGCSSRIVDPSNTVIDLNGIADVQYTVGTGPGPGLQLDGVTMRNGGVLLKSSYTYPSADVSVTRSRMTGLSSFELDVGQGALHVENSVFDHLAKDPASTCAATFDGVRGGAHVVIANNTFDLASGSNLCLATETGDGVVFDLDNNIVWGSDGTQGNLVTKVNASDTHVATVNLRNNLFNAISGPGDISNLGQTNADPKWIAPASSNYRLTAGASPSPAIDKGSLVVPFGLASTDILGVQRAQAVFPDQGAYESTPAVPADIVVTNTNDSGPGSLRAAIDAANSNPDSNDIPFNIPGACPHTIALASALPDITTSMTIYGSSQPGWAANTSATGFNATLCVLLKPASGTLSYAIKVPGSATAANLFLSSIGFGGFGQPILLLGGKNTVILGNQFGGTASGVALPGASLYGISVAAISPGGSLLIGGSDPGARNMFGGAQQAGIHIQSAVQADPQHCQVAGNLIGMNRDGSTPLPNFTGILLGGSGCFVDSNRIAGNSNDAITISGLGGNAVVGNVIGVGATGIGTFNSGAGVRITAGDNNTVSSNIIRFMVDGGVLVTGAAGDGNAVLDNSIYDNGTSADGMDIDLGALGPTANDGADIDNGPNQLQNFPLVTAVQLAAPIAATQGGTASAQGSPTNVSAVIRGTLNGIPDPVNYLVQAYFSTSCSSNGRGHAQTFLGATSFAIGQVNADTGFSLNVVLPELAAGRVVSLTATSPQGSTSEVGTCFDLANATPDSIFADGFESLAP